MLDLLELQQFVSFADCGTLSKAAELLHISQPTITRTMKHVEDAFGVPLFIRGKNKISLNETGEKAVTYARALLTDADEAVRQVQAFDRSLRTIVVESCAPAPFWSLLPMLSSEQSGMTISSSINTEAEILKHTLSGACDIGILPYYAELETISCVPYLQESLSLSVLPAHALSAKESLTFSDMNGFNFLLRSKIGFWDSLCREKMPASKFLVQTDDFAFDELVRESSLPCFTTDLAISKGIGAPPSGRILIPITDPEANVTYHLLFAPRNRKVAGLIHRFLHHQADVS